jgi:hypothetical protein
VAEIFARVSPSVAFIETPAGSGSGVLIEDGYVVTNAHVVWPFREVRVVFPDGSEHTGAPVLNWDLLGDLAVIGPLETEVEPLPLVDGEGRAIGSDVFLIGFPGEGELYPQPTLSRGLISRLREWKPIDMTYFQTDAAAADGQSGGVLVSEDGEVIGISGYFFTDAFGLVASAVDVLPRVEDLLSGENVDALGERQIPTGGGKREHSLMLSNYWDTRMFVVREPVGTELNVSVDSENDAYFAVVGVYGDVLAEADDNLAGVESGSGTTEWDVPYFVVLGQETEDAGTVSVSSNRELVPYHDPDDGILVSVGETYYAAMDHPGDVDHFVIDLESDEMIDVTVDSVLVDPILGVDYVGAAMEEMAVDDDSGGGLFDLNAKLTFRAPHSGSYFIAVADSGGEGVGGYILTIEPSPPGAVPSPVEARPTPPPIDSPFGPMALYESAQHPFSIQYPAEWLEQPAEWLEQPAMLGEVVSFSSDEGGLLVITEEDVAAYGLGKLTLQEYVDAVISMIESTVVDVSIVSREQITTEQGLSAEILTYTDQGGLFQVRRFIYVDEDGTAFSATYAAVRGRLDQLEPLIEYSFGTFQRGEP